MKIRALTEQGISSFRDWLNDAKIGGTTPPPFHLLNDESTSEQVLDAGEVETQPFQSRYELASYVNTALAAIDIRELPMKHGVWPWLSLFFIDQLCPPRPDGSRKLNEIVRYIPSTEYQKYYRHLIGFGVQAIRQLGADAEPLLVSTKPGILHTDYCEQIYGYQDLCQTRSFISVANALYFDPKNRRIKRGAAPNKRKAGTLRRLGDVFHQLDLTYDVQGLDWECFQNLLPAEFDRWRNN